MHLYVFLIGCDFLDVRNGFVNYSDDRRIGSIARVTCGSGPVTEENLFATLNCSRFNGWNGTSVNCTRKHFWL